MLSLLSSTEPLSVIEDADESLENVEEKLEEIDESKSVYNKSVVSNRMMSVNDLKTLKDDVAEEGQQLMDELYQMHFQELDIIPCTRTDKKNMRDSTELRLKEFEAMKGELMSVS
jgi:predicted phage tail protein